MHGRHRQLLLAPPRGLLLCRETGHGRENGPVSIGFVIFVFRNEVDKDCVCIEVFSRCLYMIKVTIFNC